MIKPIKKYISCLLALVTILSAMQPTVALASETGTNSAAQALWLTEIYPNDIARNDIYTGLSGPTIDSMDYIEVYNASDSELDFGTNFNLVYNDKSEKILTFNESEVIIPAHSAAVFWIRRVDLESKQLTMQEELTKEETTQEGTPQEEPVQEESVHEELTPEVTGQEGATPQEEVLKESSAQEEFSQEVAPQEEALQEDIMQEKTMQAEAPSPEMYTQGMTMPDEEAFRLSLHIPAEVPVFSVNNQTALKNTTATISIVAKSNNVTISTYTYDTTDAGSNEGTSVHLQAVLGKADALALEKQAAPSAGQVSEAQKAFLGKAILTPGRVNRSSEYEAAVTFSSSKAGSYYYAIVNDGENAPTMDTSGMGIPVEENVETQISLTNLTAGAKDLYVVVKDELNNASDPLKLDIPDFIKNTALFLTEIYPNDIPRDSHYTGLSGPTIDSMDYIEVYNASSSDLDFGANYTLVYTDLSVTPSVNKTLTFNETELIIPAHSPAVFWVRRVDLENKGKTMPDEAAFRESFNVPQGAPVFSVNNQLALKNTTAQISIVAKGSNETISTFSYVTTDAGTTEGTSVHLQAAEGIANTLAIAKQAPPTAGQVDEAQKTPKPDPGVVPEISLFEDSGKYDTIEEGKDLSIPYAYKDSTGIKSFTVYYRTNKSSDWIAQESNSFNTRTPGKFYVEIGADRFLNSEYIEYYVEASNTFRTTTTPIHRVSVFHTNEFTGLRSNLSDNETVSGLVNIIGRSQDNSNVDITIDGIPAESTRTLEQGAYFTLDISGLDGRKNAILANGELVQTFSRWYDVLPSRAVKIDNSLFAYNANGDAEITINILAGTEIDAMDISPGTASDNFNVTNFGMKLPDDTMLYPDGAVKSTDNVTLNSNKRKLELHFTIPFGSLNANGTKWDTTLVSDGVHTISIHSGGDRKEMNVNVDNTGPEISANIPFHIDGAFTFVPSYQDASAVLTDTLSLELDGTLLEGMTFNGSELNPGTHTLKASIEDELGNKGTHTWTFSSSVNVPVISNTSSSNEENDSARLTAVLSAGADAIVSFHEAQALTVGSGITVYQGSGDDTAGAQAGTLGTVTSENGSLPYQMFAFDVSDADSSLRISLDANTDYGKDVRLYVSNNTADQWLPLDSRQEEGKVTAVIETANYIRDGKVYVLAQGRGAEMNPSQTAGRTSTVSNDYVWDGTGEPAQYDFSIAWESDTQYYSERFPDNFEILNSYIAANKDRLNTRYVVHTGDIVDDIDEIYQWEYADKYMKILEDAQLPYGVLAGNHDIANHNGRYENYQTYFGANRFEGNGVYGGSYKNNIGHYDLVTAGGQDFIFVYMSYDFDKDSTAWINKVLSEHADRMAVINLHNYVNASGELDTAGQYFQKEVVAKNSNVVLVLGGHYHGAAIQVSGFDDDGDGIQERSVYQILTDYQTGEEGGNAYYKTLYFDLANGKLYMNSYSPKLNDFNYFDAPKLDSYGIGVQAYAQDIYELDLDFDIEPKKLTVNSMDAVLYSNSAMGSAAAKNASASISVDRVSSMAYDSWIAIAENAAGKAYSKLTAFKTQDGSDDTIAPKLTAGTAVRTGSRTATVKFTADEAGMYYYEVVDNGASAPILTTTDQGIVYQGNTVTSIKLTDLTAGAKDIYIVVKDKAGNRSEILKIDIPAYNETSNGGNGGNTSGNTGGNTGSGSTPGSNPAPSAGSSISESGNTIRLQLTASANSSGKITAILDSATASKLEAAVKEAEKAGRTVDVEIVLNASASTIVAAEVTVPRDVLTMLASYKNAQLKINAGIGILALDTNAVNAIHSSTSNEEDIQIEVVKTDTSGVSEDAKTQMNGRPVYGFSITSGKTIITDLGNGKAMISIPYTLLPNEEQNAIVIYAMGDRGELQYVSGKYNPKTKSVEFTITQFSKFMIGHNKITFNDVPSTAWYYDAITFNAARGVSLGTGEGEFSPNASLTRGQFLVMLMRAYGIQVDAMLSDNFSDAGNTYYTNYLATAKKFGITTGIGNNKFAPEGRITRQDMFTMIYRVLESLEKLPEQSSNKSIDDYVDAEQISEYANQAINALIKTGIINGSNGKLNPASDTSRAELAQMLYNLLMH